MGLAGALAPNLPADPAARRRSAVLLVVGGVLAVASVMLAQQNPPSGAVSPWPRLLAAGFAVFVGAAQVLAAWNRADREGARRRWFRVYALAGIALFGGMAVWYVLAAASPGEFDVRIESIPLLISLPFAGAALVAICWPSAMSRVEAVASSLDVLVTVVALALIWQLVIVPRWVTPVDDGAWERIDQVVMFATTALGFVLLAVSRRIGSLPLVQLILLAGSMMVYELSDLAGQVVRGADDVTSVTGSVVGYTVAAAIMVVFLQRPPIEDEGERARRWRDRLSLSVPVGLATVAGIIAVGRIIDPAGDPVAATVLAAIMGALLLLSVVVARAAAARELSYAREGSAERVLAERTRDGWFRALVGDSREYVFVIDADGVIVYASPRVERDVALHETPRSFEATHRHRLTEVIVGAEAAEVRLLLAQVALEPGRGPHEFQLRGHVADIDVEAVIRPVMDVEFEGFVLTARDVTATRRLQNQLDTSKRHDPLTHLLSRDGFLGEVQAKLDGDRADGRVSVVVLDIERFG